MSGLGFLDAHPQFGGHPHADRPVEKRQVQRLAPDLKPDAMIGAMLAALS